MRLKQLSELKAGVKNELFNLGGFVIKEALKNSVNWHQVQA